MPITPTTELVKPAVEEKTFDQLYLNRFNVMSRTPTESSAHAVLIPLNSTTGETDEAGAVRVSLGNLQEIAQTVPEVAQAMDALFIAVEKYTKQQGLI